MPSRRIIESWLKSITPFNYTPEELSDRLLNLGIEVESIDDRFRQLEGFLVGEVLTKEPHPNADKLSVVTVTTGHETLTVVCGAPNVAAGQKVAFAPVGTEVRSAGITIGRRKIRGIESSGMICSEAELGLGEGHDGILVLPPDAPVGAPLTEILGDVIYELEVTPNRADCLSHLGLAREVAALTGESIFLPPPEIVESEELTADACSIEIEDADLCPRYVARVIKGVKIGPSPDWLQDVIVKLGLRPRNNVVDITSYVLFECGHPLHAFDYDRLAGHRIVVRPVAGGEAFTTLDGKRHELPESALMICDAEKPVAIAGIMGGENSEITDETVNVLIESAYFNPTSIRRTARKLGLSTDASYRFERGADINNTIYAVERAASLIAQLAGGSILRDRVDVYPNVRPERIIELRFARTSQIIGIDISPERQGELLRRLGFEVEMREEGRCMVGIPSFRIDIFREIDLIEEIARLNGYDEIPAETRGTVSFSTEVDPELRIIDDTRSFFADTGYMEIVPLYLSDPETAGAYGRPVKLKNALGRDFSALRTSLAISMSKTLGFNQRHGRRDLRLFEVGKAFRTSSPDKGVVPGFVETRELAVAMVGIAEPIAWDVPERDVDLQDLRGVVDRYLDRLAVRNVEYRPVVEARWGIGAPALALFVGGEEIARLGPLDADLISRDDVSGAPVILLLDLERLARHAYAQAQYVAPSRFPVVRRDVSFLVDAGTPNDLLEGTIRGAGGALLSGVRLFDLYQGKGVEPGKKSLAYALSFTAYDRTLDDATVDAVMASVRDALAAERGAISR